MSIACSGCRDHWDEKRVEDTRLIGNVIADKINEYHKDNNKYPMSLDELTPKYIKSIPGPLVGSGEWTYRVQSDGSRWELMVDGPDITDPAMWISSTGNGWSYDSK